MKKIVPFSKEILFKTRISEVTDIEVTHSLKVNDNNEITGSFLVDGTYKIMDGSINQEEFNYDLPFTVDVNDNYDLSEAVIKINDFYFEIINEEILKINIELEISNVKERELIVERCYDEEEDDIDFDGFDEISDIEIDDLAEVLEDNSKPVINNTLNQQVNKITNLDSEILDEFKDDIVPLEVKRPSKVKINDNNTYNENNSNNITDMFSNINKEDTYKSYYVYVIRESDTLDTILTKYKITKEDLEMYNDLNDLKIGKKLIIPCSNE